LTAGARTVTTALIVIAGLYLAIVVLLFLLQRQLLYLPDRASPDLAASGLAMSEVRLATADSLDLVAWYGPAPEGGATIVYYHGNGGHIGYRVGKAAALLDAGFGLLLVEYRGYGGNPGSPSEPGLYADGRAALDFLDRAGVPPTARVLYGESLGGGVAVQMASERPAAALVLEAPATSIAAAAQFHYPFLPARWLVRDRFDSLSKIGRLGLPLLILHGAQDRVVPVRFGRELHAAANEPKEMRVFPHADHLDLDDYGAIEATVEFLRKHLPR